jgi:hypothetical protein
MVFDEQRLPGVHMLGNRKVNRMTPPEGGQDNAHELGMTRRQFRQMIQMILRRASAMRDTWT